MKQSSFTTDEILSVWLDIVCVQNRPVRIESQGWLTMDGDVFSVLQNSIPCRHLHSDCTHTFPGERARHTTL